jgi:hypothetical protein
MDLLQDEDKFVSNAMQVARGGHDSENRGGFGEGAWYISEKSLDECNYRCFVEEYTTIMALWTERQPVNNNKRVIRQACADWTELGGMWACHDETGRQFDAGEKDNGMVQLFNSNSHFGDWHKGFLRPPVKEYGECVRWNLDGNQTEEEYLLAMQGCWKIEENDGVKTIEIFDGLNVHGAAGVSDRAMNYIASTYASLFDRDWDGNWDILNPQQRDPELFP